ncbi:acetoacetyl-CoA reductase [Massilia yuzhufengensis]|uniref:3-oxoacyl-[acyl-carrier-protein] reductase n=1 Tax=Massilia yuzhufengensis TaxID=1164594 RepID=A0A1I1F657_9BURK|nr:acetoacetyl-CoA reductase [Massilia yuzhufengensis]SFB92620.1 3-oxoacyl-[acyl-carrier-protein] reductase [Massilia yuzhufengensis]
MIKRVALVTGGMGGLGTAMCRRLHLDGFTVAATFSPSNHHHHEWLASHRRDGMEFIAVETDVADFEAAGRAVQRLLDHAGRIDVLINNAGLTRDCGLRTMGLDDWHAVMGVNLDGAFNMARHAIAPMLVQQWGRIINIGSVNGQQGALGQVNYAAAKAGLHGLTKALALESARYGVTVNTVSPGHLDTRTAHAVPPQLLHERILPQIPVGRLGQPDEVAAMVSWLVSEEAGFVTGANLAINGGQHMC